MIKKEIDTLPESLKRIRPKELSVKKESVRPGDLRLEAICVLKKYNCFREQIPVKFTEKMNGRIGPCCTTFFIDLQGKNDTDFVRAVLFSEPRDDTTEDPRKYLYRSDIFLFLAHSSSLEKIKSSFPENPDMIVKIEKNFDISVHTKGVKGFKKAESGEISDFYFLLKDISASIP